MFGWRLRLSCRSNLRSFLLLARGRRDNHFILFGLLLIRRIFHVLLRRRCRNSDRCNDLFEIVPIEGFRGMLLGGNLNSHAQPNISLISTTAHPNPPQVSP